MMYALYDAHAHLGNAREQQLRETNRVRSWICATQPDEARRVECAAQENAYLTPVYGLHPWYAGQYSVEQMLPYLEKTPLLGEIGMDSVWCSVNLDQQRAVFIEQLAWAQARNLPVILHTKGQEKEIGKIIERYTMPVLVHWYSCASFLEPYLERDCYFTIGPDVAQNPAVQQVALRAPLERLLVETDGMGAVRWALGEDTPLESLPEVLLHSMRWIAKVKAVSLQQVCDAMERSFLRLENMAK